ncbi:hypothetical protein PR048_009393 [Dryococelus australis]|uniref:PiggyBac transposable element-derived protein domain-containing protein n=1 Tax=Dryococelus australis TaxID=614101 RepID=A0ABQ9HZS0_9NEOP|nr:hypothetical protein PR048_009393 [Dryococelus australis]
MKMQVSYLHAKLTCIIRAESAHFVNRNITADNWFSSIELVEQLKLKGLAYVGTVRKNKREIPPTFLPKIYRPLHSTEFAFTKDKTLLYYVPIKDSAVVLISSVHHEKSLLDSSDKKPEIIDFYNMTKAGLGALDQKCATYTVGRRTRRWTSRIQICHQKPTERAACNYFKTSWFCKR